MKSLVKLLGTVSILGLIMVAAAGRAQEAGEMPLWAYAISSPPPPDVTVSPIVFRPTTAAPSPDNDPELNLPRHVEGSEAEFTRLEIRNGLNVIDWFPNEHPPMTDIMRQGPASLNGESGFGCAFCHLPNGKGRPENAPPAGQPVGYTVQQLHDMANDLRISANPGKRNSHLMNALAAAMTEEEIQEAAEYFAAMPWTPWIEVREAELIPEMELEEGNMYITVGTEPSEPLNGRIVETPVDDYQANFLRNPHSSWIAYVPVGSLARGEQLVKTGDGKTVPCSTCHGDNLMGQGDFPGIAGRSPSYMMRQLWDMKAGTRRGTMAALMSPVIANLTAEDMTSIVAYLASLSP
jgi:cytochrome c553